MRKPWRYWKFHFKTINPLRLENRAPNWKGTGLCSSPQGHKEKLTLYVALNRKARMSRGWWHKWCIARVIWQAAGMWLFLFPMYLSESLEFPLTTSATQYVQGSTWQPRLRQSGVSPFPTPCTLDLYCSPFCPHRPSRTGDWGWIEKSLSLCCMSSNKTSLSSYSRDQYFLFLFPPLPSVVSSIKAPVCPSWVWYPVSWVLHLEYDWL